jgi:hypothetical protein
MKLEEILFNTVCQIPAYTPETTIRTIREEAETIEGFTIHGLYYRKKLEQKLQSVCKSFEQYDRLKLLANRYFKTLDRTLPTKLN